LRRQIPLDLDIANFALLQGITHEELFALDPETVVTTVHCVLPLDTIRLPLGHYHVRYKDSEVEVVIADVISQTDDPVYEAGKDFQLGNLKIPFEAFTDNRGTYPAKLISCVFPHLLPIKEPIDYEEAQIVGPSHIKDKIKVIGVIRQLASDLKSEFKGLEYGDITAFVEHFFHKSEGQPFARQLHVLTAADAYRNAVDDYFGLRREHINGTLSMLSTKFSKVQISDERELKNVVLSVINDVLVFHIQDRHWIDAFWDSSRTYKHAGKEIRIPKAPKRETAIQPTLHVILEICLSPLGIHVVRESDEGVGTLDFRCLYTTNDSTPLSVGIEFKLAHHKELRKGIRSQLPAYLRAIRSKHGIFAVMWFKSGPTIFNEPKRYDSADMCKWLIEEATASSTENGQEIASIFIDASVRPSASI
jgi:hypothetical protein